MSSADRPVNDDANAPAPIVQFLATTKRFPGVTALEEVTLEIASGELHAIVGENGAGKSTLMKILSGVITDFEGEVRIRGRAIRFEGTRDAVAAGVAMIHQELNLVDDLSAAANVFLGNELRSRFGTLDRRAMRQRTQELLNELECPLDADEPVRRMRVGDQQLVEIAKALLLKSDILVMDEPTSALTESEVARLFRVIERLRARGTTILYISHKMSEVFALADRVSVLRDGKLVATHSRAETDPRTVTHEMVGREIENAAIGSGRTLGSEILRVEGLSLPWPGHARKWRLENINLSVRRGEIVGVAGLMGAGRTELLECLFGASGIPPSGRVVIDGAEVRLRHPADAVAVGIAMVGEDRKRLGLFANLDVGRNITIATLRNIARGGIVARKAERRVASETVERLHVRTAGTDVRITSLSGGNQQKAIIGRWLLAEPKVLLLDDPTRGVDVGAKAELYRLMDTLCREGLGILVTSSELPELLTVCDRIVVLAEGRLTAEFDRESATEEAIIEAATERGGAIRASG